MRRHIGRGDMGNRLVFAAWAFALGGPASVAAQQPAASHREGRWELSGGAGLTVVDASLRGFLGSGAPEYRFANSTTPGANVGTVVLRLGYNFSRHIGVSVAGATGSGAGVSYLTPSAAVTFTGNLNAKTSSFALIGTDFTRISGNNSRVTHSVWGLQTGLGVRHMVGDDLALRLEGMLQIEGYDEVPMTKKTVVNPVVTFGVSYFVGGGKKVK